MTTAHESTGGIDQRILRRVRGLLAKAESTVFPEEAAALTAKAQELMATHAIDQALLESKRGDGAVTSIRLVMQAPYAKQKVSLVAAVAGPNRCRVLMTYDVEGRSVEELMGEKSPPIVAVVFGYPADLAIVEMLFTSLLVQAVGIMLHHGTVVGARGQNRTRSFRGSFIAGYAHTIQRRLSESQQDIDTQVNDQVDGALLPVLRERRDKVDEAVAAEFPDAGTYRASLSNASGLLAGQEAGHRADIGAGRVGGRRKAIGRTSGDVEGGK